jgi:replicative DNA helicase
VSFDPNIGHDYFADADKRYEFYHRKAKKYPFDLDYFNRITGGGLEPKTLSIILAGVNCGKSLMMCHFAAGFLSQHLNVLYITLEMCEERITQRIEANLMDITIDDLNLLPKDMFDKRINTLRNKYKGELIVHEYPTACASVDHFRALLQELAMKKKFRPDVVFVDYINLCQSARVKQGNNVNSYTLIKSIAEELRGLAVEFGFPIVSATQLTRSGFDSSDPGLTDTSESFGLPATADLMFAITTSEELDKLGQIAIKQLKNRDNDVTKNKRFVIGINRSKMKLYDVPENQQNLMDSEPDEVGHRSKGAYDKFRVDSPLNRFD